MAEQATVLVVDDNRGMLLTLARILAAEGYRVLTAEEGAEAIEIARRESLDLALIDYRMTGLNGGEVCARVSALQPRAAVYMMTAHVSPEAAESAVRSGATDILYKPLDVPALLARLAERHGIRAAEMVLCGGSR
jgi:CheY-like chemotaxis protein